MECKESSFRYVQHKKYIGIYPEWNVKGNYGAPGQKREKIGIYPEWNVKTELLNLKTGRNRLEYIQNGM